MECIADFLCKFPVNLTGNALYIFVSVRGKIYCMCNICFELVLQNENFQKNSFLKRIIMKHLKSKKHQRNLSLFIKKNSLTCNPTEVVLAEDVKKEFIYKLSNYLSVDINETELALSFYSNIYYTINLISYVSFKAAFIMQAGCEVKAILGLNMTEENHKKMIEKLWKTEFQFLKPVTNLKPNNFVSDQSTTIVQSNRRPTTDVTYNNYNEIIKCVADLFDELPEELARNQIYFFVNIHANINCICNICFKQLLQNVDFEKNLPLKRIITKHMKGKKHQTKLYSFNSYRNNSLTCNPIEIVTVDDIKKEFIYKLSTYLTVNVNENKLVLSFSRSEYYTIIRMSYDSFKVAFIIQVGCDVKTILGLNTTGKNHEKMTEKLWKKELQFLKTDLNVKPKNFVCGRSTVMIPNNRWHAKDIMCHYYNEATKFITDLFRNLPKILTRNQIYFFINIRAKVNCMCNICFKPIFRNKNLKKIPCLKVQIMSHLISEPHIAKLVMLFKKKKPSLIKRNIQRDPDSLEDITKEFINKLYNYLSVDVNKNKLVISFYRSRYYIVIQISNGSFQVEYIIHARCEVKAILGLNMTEENHKTMIEKLWKKEMQFLNQKTSKNFFSGQSVVKMKSNQCDYEYGDYFKDYDSKWQKIGKLNDTGSKNLNDWTSKSKKFFNIQHHNNFSKVPLTKLLNIKRQRRKDFQVSKTIKLEKDKKNRLAGLPQTLQNKEMLRNNNLTLKGLTVVRRKRIESLLNNQYDFQIHGKGSLKPIRKTSATYVNFFSGKLNNVSFKKGKLHNRSFKKGKIKREGKLAELKKEDKKRIKEKEKIKSETIKLFKKYYSNYKKHFPVLKKREIKKFMTREKEREEIKKETVKLSKSYSNFEKYFPGLKRTEIEEFMRRENKKSKKKQKNRIY